ncbi:MAG: ABC transporter permease [Saprospiraceae bacterium]|nr:ABC transporter permease [Saprospiraceae bacterium]
MLKNYLKITWAVMKRRKFYTFISLFGISLTLTILIVLTAFIDSLLAPDYPEVHRNRSLYVQRVKLLDQTNNSSSINPLSPFFIKTYIKTLPLVEKVSMATMAVPMNTYLNGQKGKVSIKYTDAEFWDIMQFNFLEGKGLTLENVDKSDNAVVITGDLRDQYFGKNQPVVGKTLEMDDIQYRIVGVVEGSPITAVYAGGDIYMPCSLDKSPQKTGELSGRYHAIILAKSTNDLSNIQSDFINMLHKVPLGNDKDVAQRKLGKSERSGDGFEPDTIVAHAERYSESFTSNMIDSTSSDTIFFTILSIFALLFMLLPALNLINVNISRIMERASEIGIRKAFGASAGTLTVQFVIENVILTLLGGFVAILLSTLVILYVNAKGIGPIKTMNLNINWFVVAVAMVLSLVFGLMSGAYPAWRMSKLPVVEALKN